MDLYTETTPDEAPKPPPRSLQKRRRRGGISLRLTTTGIVFLLVANLVVLGLIAWPLISARLALPVAVQDTATSPQDTSTSTITPTSTRPASTPTPQPTVTLTPIAPYPGGAMGEDIGLIVFSMHESDGTHLFAYGPPSLPLTRLTSGPWEDTNPAFSPNGMRVAFASDRSGYWDIYILDIATGALNRLTDSLSYDGSPTWSPDGQWIAYETYLGDGLGGLEIYIVPVDGSSEPIRLTEDSAADYSPAWAPVTGRKIAFVSNRSGDPEIWVADLDKTDDERFINFSQNPSAQDHHPIWSPDEAGLTWVSIQSGYHKLLDASISGGRTNTLGSGDWPVWSSDSSMLLTVINEPNQTYLAAYNQAAQGIILPPIEMPGRIEGITWADPAQIASLGTVYRVSAAITPQPLWHPILTPADGAPQGRYKVVNLADVTAPHAMLHDMVDESFISLRDTLATSIGWDLLSALDNAYVPLTSSLDPGMEQSWLYTGRGFRFTASPINAGWMAVVREDYGSRTYWRVYLRVRYQDGSAGVPLHDQPWDFSSRFSGDTSAYEQGGKLATTIPGGYWVDFTQFAQNYGWQRVEALLTWRYSYPATRFNEYIHTGGLDWTTAMLQIYPPEVLITATPLIPSTRTPSPTPRWFQSPTPTVTSSPRATLTPLPKTHTPTATPTRTQRPTSTPTIESTPTP